MQPKKTVRLKPCECAVCSIGKGISISDQLQLEEYSGKLWSYEKILAPPEQMSPPTSLNGQMKPKKTVRSKPCECAACSYGKPTAATATM